MTALGFWLDNGDYRGQGLEHAVGVGRWASFQAIRGLRAKSDAGKIMAGRPGNGRTLEHAQFVPGAWDYRALGRGVEL